MSNRMKTLISVGAELAFYANNITDIFTTKNFIEEVRAQYIEYVHNCYDKAFSNQISLICKYREFVAQPTFKLTPYETPLDNISEARPELEDIMKNMSIYRASIKVLRSNASDCVSTQVGSLIVNVLDSMLKDVQSFKDAAENMDRHLGSIIRVTDVIRAVHAYANLSGLVDYYQFKELK